MGRPATPEDVSRLCLALPEVELGITWGDRPTYKVPVGEKGRGFVLHRAARHDAVDPATGEEYDDLLVIRTPGEVEKQQLVQDQRLPFFTIDHFTNFNAVLVQQSRLGEVDVDELAEIIEDAWLSVAPSRLRRRYLAERGESTPH